jgi:simple sugar transport system permease protein
MEAALASILLASAPLIFATIGETITEKSGIINLSLDGSILLSAMIGFAAAYLTGNVWLGFVAAAIVSLLVALLVAYASISLRLNQVAVGFVLTLLCADLSSFLGNPFVRIQGPSVPHMPIPILEDIPFLGPILFDQDPVVYASILTIVAAYLFVFRTRRGLELQGMGERPEAAHARGVPVNRMRYVYAAVGGALVRERAGEEGHETLPRPEHGARGRRAQQLPAPARERRPLVPLVFHRHPIYPLSVAPQASP